MMSHLSNSISMTSHSSFNKYINPSFLSKSNLQTNSLGWFGIAPIFPLYSLLSKVI